MAKNSELLKCEQCEYIAKSAAGLRMHVMRAHGSMKSTKGLKRKYTRRKANSSARLVQFCPCCGTNLRAVEIALETIR